MKTQNTYLPFNDEEKIKINKLNDKIINLFIFTGIRRHELVRLLKNEKQGDGYKIIGKGNKFRVIPAHPKIVEIVNELKDTKWSKISLKTINNYFTKIGKEIGIKEFVPHRCRATFATDLMENGANLVAIQTLMGHANIATTAKYILLCVRTLMNTISHAIEPEYKFEGLTFEEMKREIIALRLRNNRLNSAIKLLKAKIPKSHLKDFNKSLIPKQAKE